MPNSKSLIIFEVFFCFCRWREFYFPMFSCLTFLLSRYKYRIQLIQTATFILFKKSWSKILLYIADIFHLIIIFKKFYAIKKPIVARYLNARDLRFPIINYQFILLVIFSNCCFSSPGGLLVWNQNYKHH